MKKLALDLIKLYQSTWSKVMSPSCRFVPSCSHYTYEAIDRFGLLRGTWMGVKRLSRCHPLNSGGYDPVPGVNECAAKPCGAEKPGV